MRRTIPEFDEKLFKTIVRTTFGKRRKTLRNGLKYLGKEERLLHEISFDLDQRPEELSVEDFIRLSEELKRIPAIAPHTILPFPA
jgi:16S rRNA (adenine1518-N6/adenine1519-N6)-dimethyltransferase